MGEDQMWTEIVAPLVRRCEVASAFGQQAVWDARGAEGLGKILKRMAEIIDLEIERRECPSPAPEPQP